MASQTDASSRAAAPDLVITRVLKAPRELVWRAWTEPERFRTWWGPAGFSAPTVRMDVQVGGTYLWCMRHDKGQEYWTTGVYREVVPLERLVFTDSFADALGNAVPPSHYGWPGTAVVQALVTVTLEDVGGETKMTLRHAGLPDFGGAEGGWNQAFDKMARSLATGAGRP